MRRFYFFIILLFFYLLIISVAYMLIISISGFSLLKSDAPIEWQISSVPFVSHLKSSAINAVILTFGQLLIIVLLLSNAQKANISFPIKHIIKINISFFLACTLVFISYYLWLLPSAGWAAAIMAYLGTFFLFPVAFWLLFFLVWVLLYFILKKKLLKNGR